MKRRIWNAAGVLLILIGFFILLGGSAAILIDHPNQGREAGIEMLAFSGLFTGPGAMILGLSSPWKRGPINGGSPE